ncbi:MAG: hypothetical protein ABIP55_14355, partial [Tepidisphaeraceae bacterium]
DEVMTITLRVGGGLLTLDEFLEARKILEPGVIGYLDDCTALLPVSWSYMGWTQHERNLIASTEDPVLANIH